MIQLTGLSAIHRMTDATGILQHSRFNVPARNHGYCIDDNARALLLMSSADDLPIEDRNRFGRIFASFVDQAWNPDTQSFRNFMRYDRSWAEESGSDDSNGRTIWALGTTEAFHPDPLMRRWAATLIDETLTAIGQWSSPRARAFIILGLVQAATHRSDNQKLKSEIRAQADHLHSLLEQQKTNGCNWFEASLAYDNSRLSEALMRAGNYLAEEKYSKAGADTLKWLCSRQIRIDEDIQYFSPIATSDFGVEIARSVERGTFDQQPLEAAATIDACIAAAVGSRDRCWFDYGNLAFEWFTGKNYHRIPLALETSGECFDGLNCDGLNLNQGTESILAWQMAIRNIGRLRALDNG